MMRIIQAIVVAALIAVAGFVAYQGIADNGFASGPDDTPEDQEGDNPPGFFAWPQVSDPQCGTVNLIEYSGDGKYIFQAVPADGYQFVGWFKNGTCLSDSMTMEMSERECGEIVAEFTDLYKNKIVEYNWKMPTFNNTPEVPKTFTLVMSSTDYYDSIKDTSKRNATAAKVPTFNLSDDYVVDAIVEYLEPMVEQLTDLQKAMVILYFVQDIITYETDMKQYGYSDFWTSPMEMLYSGKGDCEDTATLFVNIASRMGVECGFITFDIPGMGHMSVAIKLDEGSSVSGATTFTLDGVSYVYGETACDMRIPMGYLSPSYTISQGNWTSITYIPEENKYVAGPTISIGNNASSMNANIVYGDDMTNPPAVDLSVGDTFSYVPETSLPTVKTATGDGLRSEGGFLTFDGVTLTGVADKVGTFHVTITAVWTSGTLTQTVQQNIVLIVSAQESVSSQKELSYGAGGWTVTSDPIQQPPVDVPEDDTVNTDYTKYIVAGAVIVLIGALVLRRFF